MGAIFSVVISLIVVFCPSTSLLVFDCIPPLWVIIIGFFGAEILDFISTYTAAKIYGLSWFYQREINPCVIDCVKKFGLERGVILSTVHPERLLCLLIILMVLLLYFIFLDFIINSSFNVLSSLTLALFGLGAFIFVAGASNSFLVLERLIKKLKQ